MLEEVLSKFPELEEKVQATQLNSIQQKYRYFLRKYHKVLEEHELFRKRYEDIDFTIEER